jgi:hypothetical protein
MNLWGSGPSLKVTRGARFTKEARSVIAGRFIQHRGAIVLRSRPRPCKVEPKSMGMLDYLAIENFYFTGIDLAFCL